MRGQVRPVQEGAGAGAGWGAGIITSVLLLVGPTLTTVIVAVWSPVVTWPPLLPPELVETVEWLCMLPLLCEDVPPTEGNTTGVGTGAGVTTGVVLPRAGRSSRVAASAGAVTSKRPAAARARDVRIA